MVAQQETFISQSTKKQSDLMSVFTHLGRNDNGTIAGTVAPHGVDTDKLIVIVPPGGLHVGYIVGNARLSRIHNG